MPTSIFSFVSNPASAISSAVTASLPGLPGGVISSIQNGVNGLVSSLAPNAPRNAPSDAVNNQASPLSEFLQDIVSEGVSWNSRFFMEMKTPPPKIDDLLTAAGRNGVDERRLKIRCDMAELPGTTFATSETHYNGGPSFRLPTGIAYSDLNLQFLVSADMSEKYFFDYWHYLIKDSSDLYEYYSDMVADIEINLYTAQNEVVYGVRFEDAWPIAINPISLAWQDQEVLRLSVTFTYGRWVPLVYPAPTFVIPAGNMGNGILTQNLPGGGLLSNFNASSLIPGVASGLLSSALGGGITSGQLSSVGKSLVSGAVRNVTTPIVQNVVNSATSSIKNLLP